LTAQKVRPLIISDTTNVAAAISLVWSVNSDHQRTKTSRTDFKEESKVKTRDEGLERADRFAVLRQLPNARQLSPPSQVEERLQTLIFSDLKYKSILS